MTYLFLSNNALMIGSAIAKDSSSKIVKDDTILLITLLPTNDSMLTSTLQLPTSDSISASSCSTFLSCWCHQNDLSSLSPAENCSNCKYSI